MSSDPRDRNGMIEGMTVGVPAELEPGERRVAAVPETVERLRDLDYEVLVESGAGTGAKIGDEAYGRAGAEIVEDHRAVFDRADLVLKIHPPRSLDEDQSHEIDLLDEGDVLVSLLFPDQNPDLVERAVDAGITVVALDAVPRLTRAQSVDVLSSMAVLAGYRSVVEAASHLERSFGPQVTAAGSTPPAEVLVIGAGVAGLSAIATADDMGAKVRAFDVRPQVRSEVESVGGEFLELDFEIEGEAGEGGYAKEMDDEFLEAELDLFREVIPECDVVITTASIPGQSAPKLVLEQMVESMEPGSAVVDLAASTGGNCELTVPEEVVDHQGVTVAGPTNLPGRVATHASTYFGRNLANLVELFGPATDFEIDEEDSVVRGMLVVRDGTSKWPPPTIEPSVDQPSAEPEVDEPEQTEDDEDKLEQHRRETERRRNVIKAGAVAVAALMMVLVGAFAPPTFVEDFTIFILACVIGWLVVWNVSPSLHTPLISVTNAISGIIIVGGIVVATTGTGGAVLALGAVAAGIAAINVFGGFWVTHRMLGMFRSEDELEEQPSTES